MFRKSLPITAISCHRSLRLSLSNAKGCNRVKYLQQALDKLLLLRVLTRSGFKGEGLCLSDPQSALDLLRRSAEDMLRRGLSAIFLDVN